MEPLQYRLANVDDLEFISRLSAEVFAHYGNYGEIVAGWFSEPGVISVIIARKTEPLGFAMLAIERHGKTDLPSGHLLAIAVSPEYQKKGIGGALLTYMGDLARKHGSSDMRLWTANDNLRAISFFKKGGFKIVGSEQHYYPEGQPALAMWKELA